MKIVCPHCSFSREMPEDQLPDRPVKATCPQCRQGFSFDKSAATTAREADVMPAAPGVPPAPEPQAEQTTCPACGFAQPAGETCAACGVIYAKWAERHREARGAARAAQQPGPAPSDHRVICGACGTVQTPGSRCANCGVLLVAPASTAQPAYQFAGFWIRVGASIIDTLILLAVQFAIEMALNLAGGGIDEIPLAMISGLCSMVISLTYYIFFTGYNGQTPGKMALRIQVVRSDGTPMSYGRAFLREVIGKFASGIILGIGYLMVAFDRQKRGLHDRIAGTYVIRL